MDTFNVVNDNTIERENVAGGFLFTEKNMYQETIARYLMFPADAPVGNIPLHLKMGTFRSIYLPCINYTNNIPGVREDVIDMDARELVIDIKLMTKELLENRNLTILADASISGLYVDSLMNRKEKVNKVILYCKGKVNWSDIIYDWKDITDNLRIIIGERQLYQSNMANPFSNISEMMPPLNLRKQFNLEIEVQMDTEVNEDFLYTGELKNNKQMGKLENMKWMDIIKGIRGYSPNIYLCDLDSYGIVVNYNTIDNFQPVHPIIIITKKRISDYRRKKDKDNAYMELTFNPTIDIVFKSIEKYKEAYLALK